MLQRWTPTSTGPHHLIFNAPMHKWRYDGCPVRRAEASFRLPCPYLAHHKSCGGEDGAKRRPQSRAGETALLIY